MAGNGKELRGQGLGTSTAQEYDKEQDTGCRIDCSRTGRGLGRALDNTQNLEKKHLHVATVE